MNREEWLTQVAKKLERHFLLKGYSLAKKPYRVTCGWPAKSALSLRNRRIGECHAPETSVGGVSELFISPTLDDPLKVAGVVAHELVHVAVGTKENHGPKFKLACRYLGLVGKATQAIPGKTFTEEIKKLIVDLGEYPHKAIKIPLKAATTKPPPIKLECLACGCVLRISNDWLDSAGVPTCGCGTLFVPPTKEE